MENATATSLPRFFQNFSEFIVSNNMWQSQVEIKQYFVAYFVCTLRSNHSTVELPLWAVAVGGGRCSYVLGKLMNTYHVYTAHMSLTLNGSSALGRFKRSNVIEIHNGIMFDFYPGLPYI